MPARLVALDEGSDILLDRAMVVVGRHPQCDARLDSLRVSRHHCCMTQDHGELLIRDLGSTNGIRINGQRVEFGRLRPGDELSIAHIRFRLDTGQGHEATLAAEEPGRYEPEGMDPGRGAGPEGAGPRLPQAAVPRATNGTHHPASPDEQALAVALRKVLPADIAAQYQIKVILQVDPNPSPPLLLDPDAGSGSSTGRATPNPEPPPDPGSPDAP